MSLLFYSPLGGMVSLNLIGALSQLLQLLFSTRISMASRLQRRFALSLIVIFVLGMMPASYASAQPQKTVLLLNSYSYDMKWTRSIAEAVSKSFADVPGVDLVVEFMDTKRHYSPEHYASLFELYDNKYADTKFDAVITSDDNAVNFALKHRQTLFPDVPIIFCGVNNIALPERDDFTNITGALEVPGLTDTLQLISRVHPDLLKLYVVNEAYTVTSKKDREALETQLGQFSKMFQAVWLEDLSDEDMKATLEKLDPYSAVLLLSFFPDKKSSTFTIEEGARFISQASSRPVYSMWEYFLGEGIVGGKLTSGTYQGIVAAEMALEVLSGTSPDSIPVVSTAANHLMFDYEHLKRFEISIDDLPQESVVINKPSTTLTKYRNQLFAAIALIVVLGVLCIVLANNIRARRHVEGELGKVNLELQGILSTREGEIKKIKLTEQALLESQKATADANEALRLNMAHLRSLIESIPDLVWLKDVEGVYLFCNRRFERFFGATESEIVGKTDYDFVEEELADFFRKHDYAAMKAGKPTINEETVTYKDDGHTEELETIKTPIFDDKGSLIGVLGIARDITRRKQVADDLKESEIRYRALHNASFGAIAFHEKGVILDCNQGLAEISGHSKEELVSMDASLLIAETSRQMVMDKILSGYEESYQAVGVRKNGEKYPLRLESITIPYKGHKVSAVEFRDISPRNLCRGED